MVLVPCTGTRRRAHFLHSSISSCRPCARKSPVPKLWSLSLCQFVDLPDPAHRLSQVDRYSAFVIAAQRNQTMCACLWIPHSL